MIGLPHLFATALASALLLATVSACGGVGDPPSAPATSSPPAAHAATSTASQPVPTGSTGAPTGSGSCAEVYKVGTVLTEVLSCTNGGVMVSVGTLACLDPVRLGTLDATNGVSQPVWFVVPGAVVAVDGSLTTDTAYAVAYKKCTGNAPKAP
jgi:hypothetical protein